MQNRSAAIILNYINYKDTIACVNNIISLNAPLDIIIVDNDSPNDSYTVLSEKFKNIDNCYVICNHRNAGYAAGNNHGMRFAADRLPHIEYFCIMNPDTLFEDPGLIARMEEVLAESKDIAVVAPVMKLWGTEDFRHTCWMLPSGTVWCLKQLSFFHEKASCKKENAVGGLLKADAVLGSFFMIKKNALMDIGYLDENTFMYCEETLLGHDLKAKGYTEAVLVKESYIHNHRSVKNVERISLRRRLQKEWNGALKSRIYICKKHYPAYYVPLIYCFSALELLFSTCVHVGYLFKYYGRKLCGSKNI